MDIEKTIELPEIKRGRPIIYPFDQLKPGEHLKIHCYTPLKQKRIAVANSLNYYKRQNGLTWSSLVNIEGQNIVVYRIN